MTRLDRVAFCHQMRNAFLVGTLVGILVATAACGAYRFPGSGTGSGTVSGQVIASTCGLAGPAVPPCFQGPGSADCLPKAPTAGTCGAWPIPGLELIFANGSTSVSVKTDSNGYYSVELPSGTWTVGTTSFMRIIGGPVTLVVKTGAAVVANYVVDTGIRAGTIPGSAVGATS